MGMFLLDVRASEDAGGGGVAIALSSAAQS